jgi:hypothetical protein
MGSDEQMSALPHHLRGTNVQARSQPDVQFALHNGSVMAVPKARSCSMAIGKAMHYSYLRNSRRGECHDDCSDYQTALEVFGSNTQSRNQACFK